MSQHDKEQRRRQIAGRKHEDIEQVLVRQGSRLPESQNEAAQRVQDVQFRFHNARSCECRLQSLGSNFKSISFIFFGKVYINNSLNSNRVDGIKHSFTALSEKFGVAKKFEDVFELFGEFEKGEADVLFDVS